MIDENYLKKIQKIIFNFLDPKEIQAFIYGSRALGFAHRYSDIDIGIIGKKKIPANILSQIDEMLEESDLPYIVEVVDFSNVSKEFKNLALKKIIPLNIYAG